MNTHEIRGRTGRILRDVGYAIEFRNPAWLKTSWMNLKVAIRGDGRGGGGVNRCVRRVLWNETIKPGCVAILLSIPLIAALIGFSVLQTHFQEYATELQKAGVAVGCASVLVIVIGFSTLAGLLESYRDARRKCGLE